MRLTMASIEALKLDRDVADKIVFDDDAPGFGVRVRASGARTWVFQYKIGGRTRRLVLGQVSAIKPAKAREMFRAITEKYKIDERNVPWYAVRAFYYEANAYEAEGNKAEAIARYKLLVEHRGRTYYGRQARERLNALTGPADASGRR